MSLTQRKAKIDKRGGENIAKKRHDIVEAQKEKERLAQEEKEMIAAFNKKMNARVEKEAEMFEQISHE